MEQLTAEQLAEWEVFNRIDPVGDWRFDYLTAQLSSLVQNIVLQLYGKESATLTKPSDYMPDWDGSKAKAKEEEKVKKQSVEEMKEILLSIARTVNSKFGPKRTRTTPPVSLQRKNVKR